MQPHPGAQPAAAAQGPPRRHGAPGRARGRFARPDTRSGQPRREAGVPPEALPARRPTCRRRLHKRGPGPPAPRPARPARRSPQPPAALQPARSPRGFGTPAAGLHGAGLRCAGRVLARPRAQPAAAPAAGAAGAAVASASASASALDPCGSAPPPRGGAHAGRGRSRDAERARTPRQPLLSAARKSREQAALTLTGWGFVRGSGVGGRPRGAGGVREWGAPVAWVWRRGDPVSQLQRWLPSLLWEIRSKYRFPRLRWWLGRLVV